MPSQLAALNATNAAARSERVRTAWALRVQGATVRGIAEKLNVCEATAWDFCREGLALARETAGQDAREWRDEQLHRLSELIAAWGPLANEPIHPQSREASAIVVRCMEHQARLLGLDRVEGVVDFGKAESLSMEEALKSPATREALRRALNKAESDDTPALPA